MHHTMQRRGKSFNLGVDRDRIEAAKTTAMKNKDAPWADQEKGTEPGCVRDESNQLSVSGTELSECSRRQEMVKKQFIQIME